MILGNSIVTNSGANLTARALAGEGQFVFTKVGLGSGTNPTLEDDIKNLTDLVSPELDGGIQSTTVDGDTTIVDVLFTNSTVTSSFAMNEIGVYAKLVDDSGATIGKETLYTYTSVIEADTMPSSDTETVLQFNIYVEVSEGANATFEVSELFNILTVDVADVRYATKQEVEDVENLALSNESKLNEFINDDNPNFVELNQYAKIDSIAILNGIMYLTGYLVPGFVVGSTTNCFEISNYKAKVTRFMEDGWNSTSNQFTGTIESGNNVIDIYTDPLMSLAGLNRFQFSFPVERV